MLTKEKKLMDKRTQLPTIQFNGRERSIAIYKFFYFPCWKCNGPENSKFWAAALTQNRTKEVATSLPSPSSLFFYFFDFVVGDWILQDNFTCKLF